MEIQRLSEIHFQPLFEFEAQNLSWFEQYVPPRPESYKNFSTFSDACAVLIREQDTDLGYYFVGLLNEKIVLRANIFNIQEQTAEVGIESVPKRQEKGTQHRHYAR
ncbi:hypothetical protein [Vibrio mexicanus]|uniref:hypothetical protein n=1 Tax=Vibrio mexicanus TaxID=1004326 RepID=UPI000699DB2A|nr:hypothetical protein [Vibrio mexicanus]